jgi:hypothetical protein
MPGFLVSAGVYIDGGDVARPQTPTVSRHNPNQDDAPPQPVEYVNPPSMMLWQPQDVPRMTQPTRSRVGDVAAGAELLQGVAPGWLDPASMLLSHPQEQQRQQAGRIGQGRDYGAIVEEVGLLDLFPNPAAWDSPQQQQRRGNLPAPRLQLSTSDQCPVDLDAITPPTLIAAWWEDGTGGRRTQAGLGNRSVPTGELPALSSIIDVAAMSAALQPAAALPGRKTTLGVQAPQIGDVAETFLVAPADVFDAAMQPQPAPSGRTWHGGPKFAPDDSATEYGSTAVTAFWTAWDEPAARPGVLWRGGKLSTSDLLISDASLITFYSWLGQDCETPSQRRVWRPAPGNQQQGQQLPDAFWVAITVGPPVVPGGPPGSGIITVQGPYWTAAGGIFQPGVVVGSLRGG